MIKRAVRVVTNFCLKGYSPVMCLLNIASAFDPARLLTKNENRTQDLFLFWYSPKFMCLNLLLKLSVPASLYLTVAFMEFKPPSQSVDVRTEVA
jgi:hypothetical protein